MSQARNRFGREATSSARAANKRDSSVRFLSFARLGGLPDNQVTARREVPTSRVKISRVRFVCRAELLDVGSRQGFAGGGACTFHLATKFLNTRAKMCHLFFCSLQLFKAATFFGITFAMKQRTTGYSLVQAYLHAQMHYLGNLSWPKQNFDFTLRLEVPRVNYQVPSVSNMRGK